MPRTRDTLTRAEIRLPTAELRDDLPLCAKAKGMRLDMIHPADTPQVAVLWGHGLRLRIERGANPPARCASWRKTPSPLPVAPVS